MNAAFNSMRSNLILILLIIFIMSSSIDVSAAKQTEISIENNLKPLDDDKSTSRNVNSDIWPMFHQNPALTGFSNSTAPDSDDIIWTYKIDSANEEPPIVTNDKVFVVSHYVPFLNGSNLFALNEKTGKVMWKFIDQGGNIYTTPAVDNGRVYVAPDYHGLYALDEADGEMIWNFNGRDIEYFDHSYSPTIFAGDVFISLVAKYNWDDATRSDVYRLDGETGDVLWKYVKGGGVPAVDSSKVYFYSFETDSNQGHYQINAVKINGNNDGTVLDYPTTDLVWTFDDFEHSPYIYPTNLVVSNNKVIFGSQDDFLYALHSENGSLAWKYNASKQIHRSTPAIYNNKIYFGTETDMSGYGDVFCLDIESGTFNWKKKFLGDIESSIAVADDKLFFQTAGVFYALDTETGSIKWMNKIGEFGSSSPSIANGKVFVTSVDSELLYCFGTKINEPPIINEISADPVLIYKGENSTIYVDATDPDNDSLIYKYDASDGIISGSGPSVTWTAPDTEGEFTITATADDGLDLSNSMNIVIAVVPKKENHIPIISKITAVPDIIGVKEISNITVTASDLDNDELFYFYNTTGGSIIGTGPEVLWSAPDSEGIYTISIKVGDGIGVSDEKTLKVTVERNYKPIIEDIIFHKNQIYTENLVNITVKATDKNNDQLFYNYDVSGGKIYGKGANITWKAPVKSGNYEITISVFDGELYSDIKTIVLKVENRNSAPRIISISSDKNKIEPGGIVIIDVKAVDDDIDDILTYSYSVTHGIIKGSGYSVIWNAPEKEGEFEIIVVIEDLLGDSVNGSIIINVQKSNENDKNNNDINNQFGSYSFVLAIMFIVIIITIIFTLLRKKNKNLKNQKSELENLPLEVEPSGSEEQTSESD